MTKSSNNFCFFSSSFPHGKSPRAEDPAGPDSSFPLPGSMLWWLIFEEEERRLTLPHWVFPMCGVGAGREFRQEGESEGRQEYYYSLKRKPYGFLRGHLVKNAHLGI